MGGSNVVVSGIARFSKAGVSQQDGRTLRPIESYTNLEMMQHVTFIVIEILSFVLYTGPMFVLYCGHTPHPTAGCSLCSAGEVEMLGVRAARDALHIVMPLAMTSELLAAVSCQRRAHPTLALEA